MTWEKFETLDPQNSPPAQAEVAIQMMTAIFLELTAVEKDLSKPESQIYSNLITAVLQKDILRNCPCVLNHFCLKEYLEMVRRWSQFFKGESLVQIVDYTFHHEHTLQSTDMLVVKEASYNLKLIFDRKESITEIVRQ